MSTFYFVKPNICTVNERIFQMSMPENAKSYSGAMFKLNWPLASNLSKLFLCPSISCSCGFRRMNAFGNAGIHLCRQPLAT